MFKRNLLTDASEASYVKKVYRQIIYLALFAHISYILIFTFLSYHWLCVYNLVSTLFYCGMLYAVHRGCYRVGVTAVHAEVILFTVLCTVLAGWELGIPFYLVAMSSLVYFCPFDHKYVPYFFSASEILVFVALRLYTLSHPSYYPALSASTTSVFYLYNALACFAIILYAAFVSDLSAAVSKRKLQDENKSLSALANYDQLTGLLSRHSFLDKLKACAEQEVDFCLAMGDIDDFKSVNDHYGHDCGDYVLHETARLMRSLCGVRTEICRWGGEEFLFLFRATIPDTAAPQLQALCEAISAHPYAYASHQLHVTLTLGFCGSGELETGDYSSLIQRADKRMYQGKIHGKNQVVGPPESAAFSE